MELLRSVAGRKGTQRMHCAPFDRPKDVQGCSAAPEELLQQFFLLCSCFVVPNVCVCVYVCVCVCTRDWMVASNADSPLFCLALCWWWCLQSPALLLQLDGLCCLRAFVVCDWTLGAATGLSWKSAMSVRRHTKVLADGER